MNTNNENKQNDNVEPIQDDTDTMQAEILSGQTDGPTQTDEDIAKAATDETSNVDVSALNTKIKALEEEVAQLKDRSLRALAEAENTRRRAEKDMADAQKFGIANFAKSLVGVADNLRRAVDAVPEELKKEHKAVENMVVGVEATERELLKSFEMAGIAKIDPQGEIFDPNFHEVMFEVEAAGQEPGTVMQVVEVGYKIHDRILRPARVGVAKAGPEHDGAGGGHNVDEMA